MSKLIIINIIVVNIYFKILKHHVGFLMLVGPTNMTELDKKDTEKIKTKANNSCLIII
jgi:hypothetical protein